MTTTTTTTMMMMTVISDDDDDDDEDDDDDDARDYRRATRRARKSLKGARQHRTWSEMENVDELERRLRQYQTRRIAEEIARLRTIHAKPDVRKRHRRRRCRSCRRRRLRSGRKTAIVGTPKSASLPS